MRYSLYKREKTPYYWCRIVKSDGKIVRESTKCRRKRDAIDYVNSRIHELSQGDIKGLYSKTTLKHIIDRYIQDLEENGRKSILAVKSNLKHLVRYFGEDKKVLEISKTSILDYRTHRLNDVEKPAARASVNREVSILHRMMRLAYEYDLLKKVPSFPRKYNEDKFIRQDFYTHQQYKMLLDVLPQHLKPLIQVAYTLGIRKGNLLNMTWDEIGTEAGTIRILDTKSRKPLHVKLPRDLRELFGELKRNCIKNESGQPLLPYVFTNRNGTKQLKNFRTDWKKSLEDAGLNDVDDKHYFHGFRRTAVRNLTIAGTPENVAMMISGHKTRAVFDRYNIVEESQIEDALEKTEKHLENI